MKESNGIIIALKESFGVFGKALSKLKYFFIVVVAGTVLGTQIYNPNKRAIEAAVGFILVLMLWNFSTINALWFMVIIYPFPFAISWGTSNFVFMLIITLILIIRVTAGQMKFKFDNTVALPVLLMVLSYIISLKNVPLGMDVTVTAFANTGSFFAAATFMFLLINFIDDEEKLRRTMQLMMVTATLVIGFTLFELAFPGRVIVPNWLYTVHKTELVMKGIRVEGPFHDYELNAEFFTLNSFLIFFMLVRTRRMLTRFLFGSLLIVDLFLMFATITRGAFFSLILGIFYLMVLSRKDLNIVKLTFIFASLAVLIIGLEAIVAQYTTSGSLFDRVVKTSFRSGVIPNNRYNIWKGAIERGMRYPLFGKGPGWDFASRFDTGFWPHNLYLFYFNITGIFGLLAFLFLVFKLVRCTFTGLKASVLSSPYPQALMKILHVVLVIFLFDQLKIDYIRNRIYTFFIWLLFAIIVITYNVIKKNEGRDRMASTT